MSCPEKEWKEEEEKGKQEGARRVDRSCVGEELEDLRLKLQELDSPLLNTFSAGYSPFAPKPIILQEKDNQKRPRGKEQKGNGVAKHRATKVRWRNLSSH